jgi:hypothetical protein
MMTPWMSLTIASQNSNGSSKLLKPRARYAAIKSYSTGLEMPSDSLHLRASSFDRRADGSSA